MVRLLTLSDADNALSKHDKHAATRPKQFDNNLCTHNRFGIVKKSFYNKDVNFAGVRNIGDYAKPFCIGD